MDLDECARPRHSRQLDRGSGLRPLPERNQGRARRGKQKATRTEERQEDRRQEETRRGHS